MHEILYPLPRNIMAIIHIIPLNLFIILNNSEDITSVSLLVDSFAGSQLQIPGLILSSSNCLCGALHVLSAAVWVSSRFSGFLSPPKNMLTEVNWL